MLATRQQGSAAEMEIRRRLHRLGLRYRVDTSPVPGIRSRADVVFSGARLAVFVDGCFWHSCPIHGSAPKENAAWWASKLQQNADRDRATDTAFAAAGWTVARVWEHEDPSDAAQRIAATYRRLRAECRE